MTPWKSWTHLRLEQLSWTQLATWHTANLVGNINFSFLRIYAAHVLGDDDLLYPDEKINLKAWFHIWSKYVLELYVQYCTSGYFGIKMIYIYMLLTLCTPCRSRWDRKSHLTSHILRSIGFPMFIYRQVMEGEMLTGTGSFAWLLYIELRFWIWIWILFLGQFDEVLL